MLIVMRIARPTVGIGNSSIPTAASVTTASPWLSSKILHGELILSMLPSELAVTQPATTYQRWTSDPESRIHTIYLLERPRLLSGLLPLLLLL